MRDICTQFCLGIPWISAKGRPCFSCRREWSYRCERIVQLFDIWKVNNSRTIYVTSHSTPCCLPVLYHKLLCYLMLTIYLHRSGLAEGQLAGVVGHSDEVSSAARQGMCWSPEKKLSTVRVRPHRTRSAAADRVPRKSCCLWCVEKKNPTAQQATDENIIWRMRTAR